jgi:phage gp36-like protein
MPTPSSSSTAYASPADMKTRYDVRVLQELCSDSDTRISIGGLDTNERLLAALADASGLVESACFAGKAYQPTDLAALTGVSLAYLKRLVCDLAMGCLFLARPDRKGEPPKSTELALERLEQMRRGEMVFGLREQQGAGLLDCHIEPASEVEARKGIVVEMGRFFSRRNNRLHG